jgi:adenylate cyclase
MDEGHTTRRLAAVLAADVVGYSRMMAVDEVGTLASLKRHRETVFNPAVAGHNGRVVKLIGDGTLVEFSSVVDAVKCALTIQRAMKAESGAKGIMLRIGVNLGDVIIDGDDIYGDGVNVAARLEPLAEPGGICVASIVNESIGSRVEITFSDGGEVTVKNIDRPIRVWKWHPDRDRLVRGALTPPVVSAQARRTNASIAVMPFDNMSGDPEQEYFSDGITEDIITDLSKVGGLMVIARNSSFAYKGKRFDVRDVGRNLGVNSVLEGSVRRAGKRVRINAQLIDASNGGHLWAERYDRDLTDIFEVQDEVTHNIVSALKVTLTPAEEARISDDPTDNLQAHDLVLRFRQLIFGATQNRRTFERSITLLNRAVELDPDHAEALAGLAITYVLDFVNRWSDDPDRSLQIARDFADRAIEKGPNEVFGHLVAARVATLEKDLERATAETEFVLSLDPNNALAHASLGNIELYSGHALDAIPHLERAMQLDPAFAQQYLHFLGTAYLIAGRCETAAVVFKQRILLAPETDLSRAFLAAALGHLGQAENARQTWQDLMKINPKYSFAEHVGRLPFKVPADVETIREGLARAGLVDELRNDPAT